jgi:hypothetical protein
MKFQVIVGTHYQLSGTRKGRQIGRKRYKAGDVVESAKDLCAAFPNKFQRIASDEASPSAPPPLSLHARYLGEGLWDVVNRYTGEALNSEPLLRNAAMAMAEPDKDDLEREALDLRDGHEGEPTTDDADGADDTDADAPLSDEEGDVEDDEDDTDEEITRSKKPRKPRKVRRNR